MRLHLIISGTILPLIHINGPVITVYVRLPTVCEDISFMRPHFIACCAFVHDSILSLSACKIPPGLQ